MGPLRTGELVCKALDSRQDMRTHAFSSQQQGLARVLRGRGTFPCLYLWSSLYLRALVPFVIPHPNSVTFRSVRVQGLSPFLKTRFEVPMDHQGLARYLLFCSNTADKLEEEGIIIPPVHTLLRYYFIGVQGPFHPQDKS